MKRLSVLGLLSSLFLWLGGVPAPGAATSSSRTATSSSRTAASPSGVATSRYAYHWPIKPFDRQHPIRGAFGDPRTMAIDQPFGVTGPTDSGSYSFHSGVDIAAKPGTPVYPVVSGIVVRADLHGTIVHTVGGRAFRYWHLRSNVWLGEHVVAEHTVLGWIRAPFDHVHFTEIDHHRVQNPLARGHLGPYADHTTPRAIGLDISDGSSPQLTQGGLLKRSDELAIEAVDQPAMPGPGPWADLPQAPALVEWRLRADGQGWGGWHVVVDFRFTEPPRGHFWNVYMDGTYQNFPVFDHRLSWGVGGRYLFRVGLDPSLLQPGPYELESRVADIRGNSSTTTWSIEIPGN
jgi:hypothetical protein